LENILLDADFNIKIADFGFAAKLREKNKMTTKLGTHGYMAPEFYEKESYDGKTVDIFALGVALFTIYSGFQPFKVAHF
jgi:serine/threonine protein kinase